MLLIALPKCPHHTFVPQFGVGSKPFANHMLSPNAGFWWCRSCLHWELPGLSNESQVEIMIDKFWRTLSLQLKMARRQVMPSRGDSRPNWCSMTAFKKFDLSRTFDAYQWLMSVFTLLPKNNGILDLSHAFQFAAQLAVAKASFFVPWTGGNKHGTTSHIISSHVTLNPKMVKC